MAIMAKTNYLDALENSRSLFDFIFNTEFACSSKSYSSCTMSPFWQVAVKRKNALYYHLELHNNTVFFCDCHTPYTCTVVPRFSTSSQFEQFSFRPKNPSEFEHSGWEPKKAEWSRNALCARSRWNEKSRVEPNRTR